MNLAMASPTRDETFVKAITYYQNRLKDVSKEYIKLQKKVDSFISQFPKED
jgi:predicted metal-dependent hydrolase